MRRFSYIAIILVTALDANASGYPSAEWGDYGREGYFYSERKPASTAVAVDTAGRIDDTLRAFVIGQGETRKWHILRIVETMKELARMNGVNLAPNIDLEESLQALYSIALEPISVSGRHEEVKLLYAYDAEELPKTISPVILEDGDDE